jgi:hypothetical protein
MTFSLRAPRAALAALTALALTLALATLAPAARGQTPAPSPSPSASGSPGGSAGELAVELLNPSAAYDATPKVSDRFDGVDTAYTVAARTTGSAESAIVEAYVAPQNDDGTYANEITIGGLTRVTSASDVWELDWDIPSSVDEGAALITVRAFVEAQAGFVETGSDSVAVDIFYSDPAAAPLGAYETVELAWPQQDGALGWYRPRVGAWRVMIDGTTSPGATFVQLLISTSPPGEPLTFTPCGSVATAERPGGFRSFASKCTLSALANPSQVRAIAALAEFRNEATGVRFVQAADVSAVRPYLVKPEEMSIRISPPVRRAAAPATVCQEHAAVVTDNLGRLVLGANVDVHASGPADELILMANGLFPPEGHSTEQTEVCPGGPPVPTDPRTQGDHNVPGGTDSKHMESGLGTGLDYLAEPPGQVVFRIASEAPGFTDVTAWVDDEEIRKETDQRPPDNDTLDPGEPVAQGRTQWLGAPLTVSLDPVGGTAPAGACFPYTVKARAGTVAVPGINVDLHATGPDDELDFCDPPGALPRLAPSPGSGATAHEAEDTSESHHFNSTGPDAQHTEGTTDDAGNLVVGLTSPSAGDSTVVAWIDGEEGSDDDVQGGGEAVASGTISWASSMADAHLSFVNPSPYGSGTAGAGTGIQVPDSGGVARVLVRVDMAAGVPGVEVLLSRDARRTYTFLGEAARVGTTDLYELAWPVDLPDGTYGLRARIKDTTIVEDLDVKVGAGELAPMTPHPPYETLQLDKPAIAAGVPFSGRATVVSGRASAGAEGVDVFYTKVPAKDTPRQTDWIFCGYADLSGTGTAPQPFSTLCRLAGADQAAQVTGIAAITFDCTVAGCDANPTPPPPAPNASAMREQGGKETGQAVRVFGYEANPLLGIEPAEAEAVTGDCRRFELVLRDQTGQPLGSENVDLHLAGPSSTAHFCRPPDAAPSLRAPDAGDHTTSADPNVQLEAHHEADGGAGSLHTEGETLPDGKLVFGVTSESAGDAQLSAWLDRNDDDAGDATEPADGALLHWVAPRGCSIVGSDGPDVLKGTPGDDVFCGLEGDDTIKGRGGADTIFGGQGADRLFGGDGADTLRGAKGRDLLNGGGGRDTCRGGPGADTLRRCEALRAEQPAVAPAYTRRSGA